jgi:DNA-binding CsgD family transcriptional regulator
MTDPSVFHHEGGCPCLNAAILDAIRRRDWPPLTGREIQVLDLIARGHNYEVIGEELGVTVDTVKSHMRRIFRKLKARNGPHAVAIGIGLHLIIPSNGGAQS